MKKTSIPWYLSSWFILLLFFASIFFYPLVIAPIILLILQFKRIKYISDLALQLENLKANGFNESIELSVLINQQKTELRKTEKELQDTRNSIEELTTSLLTLKNEYIEIDEAVLLQSFGFYTPKYDLVNSESYKTRLDIIRDRQKEMVKDKTATTQNDNWTVNGKASEGKKMINDSIKLAIRSFNNECDNAIAKVTIANIDSTEKRILKSFETINKLNRTYNLAIRQPYLDLKLEELNLALEYALKIAEEKEEQRQIKEQMREEEKVRREIEKLKEKVEKEEQHFSQAISKLMDQKLNASSEKQIELELKIKELQDKLNEVLVQKDDVLNRERNTRAGYVYVISNIGSFGENVYKIGMTRRLEPMDRVKELGDASVPFKFDVHALIFSEDAPTLENILHKTFHANRLNLINERKEFFKVSLQDIRKIVEENHDKTVEFTMTALAEEHYESVSIRENSGTREMSYV